MYKVVRAFFDSTDNNRLYGVGDVYPAEGAKATKKRIDELVNGTNRNGKIYIEEVDEGRDAQTPPQNNGDTENGNAPQNPEE